ncbi:hypothetical protein G6R29_00040 [Fructobacillus sp. M2-14]|uniref:Uncharacterized protein n=1 Tax=Fructobacillus broussonetiae TaxID=2713173 RepID=A0ABS5QZ15_9LACO|nr:hypothetical protein [Fructobacillus broussonetiae]MBS9338027.1 hypothetical protein [Fructobacillus broussonetiae]
MKAINIPAETLMKVLVGQEVKVNENIKGVFLLVAKENKQPGLPSGMAACVADIALGQVQLQKLVHPLNIAVDQPDWQPYEVDESFFSAEAHNWFGPEAIVIEKRFEDFQKEYEGTRDDQGRIPRDAFPDDLAKPLLQEDAYWASYKKFVNDPDGTLSEQFKPFFSE